MYKIELIRQPPEGNAVRGRLIISTLSVQTNKELQNGDSPQFVNTTNSLAPVGERGFDTLENAKYIIPAGTYGLTVTYSPKFKRMMPLITGVQGRSGIRIHPGTRPEHSLGCVLVKSRSDEETITNIIGSSKQNITIYDESKA